jgi:thymidine kinase
VFGARAPSQAAAARRIHERRPSNAPCGALRLIGPRAAAPIVARSLASGVKRCTIVSVPPAPRHGRIEVVHGSMFAGKTEYMIARLRQERAAGKTVVAFKHAIDDRYDADHLVTHGGDHFDAIRASDALAIPGLCGQADVVAIDEGHFFKAALVPVVEQLAARGATVIVAGITYDIWGRAFDPMPQLIEMADEEVVRQAPCRVCGSPAPYNQRNTPVNTLHMVGGLDDYEPRCAEHFTPVSIPPEPR